jgi:hypothetical protein
LEVTRNASSEGLGCVTDEENGRATNAKILMELFRCREQFTFSSKSRFASSSKNCRILRAPVRAIAAATKSRTGTSAAAMKFLELGVNAAQLHMSPAGDSRPSGLDDGKPSAKLKFEPGKQYSSHPSSPPKKSLEKNLVITGIFLQGLAATGCSRISRGRSSTAAVSGDDDDEDDDDNELAAAALLELSKTTGR